MWKFIPCVTFGIKCFHLWLFPSLLRRHQSGLPQPGWCCAPFIRLRTNGLTSVLHPDGRESRSDKAMNYDDLMLVWAVLICVRCLCSTAGQECGECRLQWNHGSLFKCWKCSETQPNQWHVSHPFKLVASTLHLYPHTPSWQTPRDHCDLLAQFNRQSLHAVF